MSYDGSPAPTPNEPTIEQKKSVTKSTLISDMRSDFVTGQMRVFDRLMEQMAALHKIDTMSEQEFNDKVAAFQAQQQQPNRAQRRASPEGRAEQREKRAKNKNIPK